MRVFLLCLVYKIREKNLQVTGGNVPEEGHLGPCSCLRDFCKGRYMHMYRKPCMQTLLCRSMLSACSGYSIFFRWSLI